MFKRRKEIKQNVAFLFYGAYFFQECCFTEGLHYKKAYHRDNQGIYRMLSVQEDKPVQDIDARCAKPFVKWVGGKRSILTELQARIPQSYHGYYECFIGGGALFFAQQPKPTYISDTNPHLIASYQAIRDDVGGVIKALEVHRQNHCKDYYAEIRSQFSAQSDATMIAAIFIYLNKTCFNGLYRVNRSGGFNVPMGDYKNPMILDEVNLKNVSAALQGVDIHHHEFDKTPIQKGAFYYLDPPYHQTYSAYAKAGFGDDRHRDLANFCKQIDKAGAYFMLSNSDTDFIRDLYADYCIEQVSALRSVSCKATRRGREDECVIRNYQ